MKAVLFIGHGSRDSEGNEQVLVVTERLKGKMGADILVETCFLEFQHPTITEGIQNCIEKGASHVHLIPIMLLPAGHSKIHIPAAIDEAKEQYPHIGFTYGRPIGIHEETFEILKTRLHELGENTESPADDTAILLLGRGGSDPDANSELYKISRLLWEKTNYKMVEPAFMGVTDPLVAQGIERCVKLGAKRIIILPYFLFTGILIKRLEGMVEQFNNQSNGTVVSLAGYFGFHEKLETILLDRAHEALEGEVKMNCDTCVYRKEAMEHIDHHHHHHDHDHHHHHDHSHHHHDHSHHHHELEKAGK
ncbi:sirohydrochlorin chelatase [Priestia koreensis]|uniref:sirohydrochlorin chelatase n=1 Tax=Priestia koreensis TaxID=284581 RepID=UPI001F55E84C|nr:sirohydrochlorin chelatase [Priestia koreensis]UNL83819.1 sirohydrochlorin chelatase [Priestia koreensis]